MPSAYRSFRSSLRWIHPGPLESRQGKYLSAPEPAWYQQGLLELRPSLWAVILLNEGFELEASFLRAPPA